MNFLPISININDRPILVIGGGKVAMQKIKLLQRFTSRFRVIAPEVLPQIKEIKGIEVVERIYQTGDLDGFLLVFAATDSREINRQIQQEGAKKRCLVNVVDDPGKSDFVSPAIFVQENMTVAVGSDGKDLKQAIAWRNKLKACIEDGRC